MKLEVFVSWTEEGMLKLVILSFKVLTAERSQPASFGKAISSQVPFAAKRFVKRTGFEGIGFVGREVGG